MLLYMTCLRLLCKCWQVGGSWLILGEKNRETHTKQKKKEEQIKTKGPKQRKCHKSLTLHFSMYL